MVRLSNSLNTYHINALQEIADHLALIPKQLPVRKAWLVSELSSLIPKLARSREFIQSLTDVERAALAIILEQKGDIRFQDVSLPLMLTGMVHIEGQPEATFRPKVADVLSDLLHKGLIVNLAEPRSSATLRTLTLHHRFDIPSEVRSALPASLLSLPEAKPDAAHAETLPPFRASSRDLQQFLRELLFTWSELRRQPAQRLKGGGLCKRDRRRLANALGLDEELGLTRVEQLQVMLATLNLVSEDDTTITAIQNSAVTLFWGAKSAHHLRSLMRAYIRLSAPFPEDAGVYRLFGYYQGITRRSSSEIREKALDTLAQASDLGWLSFSLFLGLVTGGRPGSLILDEEMLDVMSEHLRWYGANHRNEMAANIQGLERLIAQAALEELGNMGMVDLGFQPSGSPELVAVRVSPVVQAYHADRAGNGGQTELPWQVILQPDFQMLALGPVPLRVLAGLEQFARREKIDESVITYRLTRDYAYQALQRGETTETILAYLEEATGQPIPQNIQRSLEEWSHRYERIVVQRRIRILQVDNAEFLDELLQDSALQQHLHPIDDRTAWFHPDDIKLVQDPLFARGILAAHSHGAEADLPNSIKWHDGELESRTALPSLYVTGTLGRFAEAHNGRWKVTPQAIQAATSVGVDPSRIIAQLEQMTGTPIPDDWDRRIKSWGKHYGEGLTAQVRLLRLKRDQALDELRDADPVLRRWLRPLPGTSNLAVVNEGHWDEVAELLASLGVEIESGRWW